MKRVATALLLALVACAEAPRVPAVDLAIELSVTTQRVPFGEPFELTVDRVWDAALTPEEWSDESLSPLFVRAGEVARIEADGRVLERRAFTARAFEMGDVRVLPPLFVASDADGERTVTGDGLDLFVTPTLDASATGEVEFPPGQPPREFAWAALLAGLGSLIAAGAAVVLGARRLAARPQPVAPPLPPPAGPEIAALARLGTLRGEGRGARSSAAFYDELASVMRAYVVARHDAATEHATSLELLTVAASDVPAACPALRSVLVTCDLVRFARHEPSTDETSRVFDDAERYVRESTA